MDEVHEIIAAPDIPSTVSVASYNIGFSVKYQLKNLDAKTKRNANVEETVESLCEEILTAILKFDPDVLALQGLNKSFCEYVFRVMKCNGYSFARFDLSGTPRSEFEILFVKNRVPTKRKEYTPFVKTTQNQGLSKVLIQAAPETPNPFYTWIFTSELERDAIGNVPRKTQIVELDAESKKLATSSKITNFIFIGETNIPSWQDSAVTLPGAGAWQDAWKICGTSDNEKTTLNDRSDRIWYTGDIEPIEFDVIRPFSGLDSKAGVFAVFQV